MEVTLDDIIVTKTGDSNGGENCNRYGQNAALLIKDGATATINRADITSTARGSAGVFAYGKLNANVEDTTLLNINDTIITTNGDNSSGVMVSGGGQLYGQELTVTTSGQSSASLGSDRGGGKLDISGGNYITGGINSPVVSCTTDMNIKEATLISHNSCAVILKGRNKLTLKNCVINANNNILHQYSQQKCGILVYDTARSYSMSQLFIENSTINNNVGHAIHITNTNAKITFNNVVVNNTDIDDVLLSVANDGWNGVENQADVEFHDAIIGGNIIVDNRPSTIGHEDSTLKLMLSDRTIYTGAINPNVLLDDQGDVNLSIGKDCKWILTHTSYVKSLNNKGEIELGSYKLYVDGHEYTDDKGPDISEAILRLDGRSYSVIDKYAKLKVEQDVNSKSILATIVKSGKFRITGRGINTVIKIATDVKDVTIMLSDAIIDNTNYAKNTKIDSSVILLQPNADVQFVLEGNSKLIGSKTFVEYPRPIIRGNESNISFEGYGVLDIEDATLQSTELTSKFTDGILNSIGQINFNSGIVNILVNGSAIRVTKSIINCNGADIKISHCLDNAIDATDSNINITSGLLDIDDVRQKGISCKYSQYTSTGNVNVFGGILRMYKIGNIGIRSENVTITGGRVDITNIYDGSGDVTYVPGNDVRNKNTIYPVNDNTDKIRINLDTGIHHGIEVGNQARKYSYLYVPTSDTEHEAGKVYTVTGTGSLNISGGTININTQVTGLVTNILYTEGYEKCSNNQFIIGSPGHGMLSHGSVVISGGHISIRSGGNGIHCDGSVSVNGLAVIDIPLAYTGILGSSVIIGTANSNPTVTITGTGDDIVTISQNYTYTYDDSRNESSNYTLDVVRLESGGSFYLYDGYVNTYKEFANPRIVELRLSPDGTKQSLEYGVYGYTINSNGYIYLSHGDIKLYGMNTFDMLPTRQQDGILFDQGTVLLLTGVDLHTKCIPRFGTGSFIIKEDSDDMWQPGDRFKVSTREGQVIYDTTLPVQGGTLLFGHPELENRRTYDVLVGNKTYLLKAKESLR